jgi:phosphatidylglycerol lysyltransferase
VRVLSLLRAHGFNRTSFQVLEPGFSYWFCPEGCVAYADTGGAWVAAGAPIASTAALASVARAFAAAARAAGRRACFFAVETRLLEAAPDLAAIQIGEQPVWDPARWADVVASSRSLREQIRRARAKGVRVRTLEPAEVSAPDGPARRAIEALIARWLATRAMAPMGFLVDVQPFGFPEERRYLVAERDGEMVAFLSAVPIYARGGWLIEDLVRGDGAPNGTGEMLVDRAMRLLADEGSHDVTLGLAPLAGGVNRWLGAARFVGRALYDFRGVHAFKAKLKPDRWEPTFLAYPKDGGSPLWSVYDVLVAFARGSLSLFGLETVLRGPAFVVRSLAALLIPWTLLLASAETRRWFPAPWVKWAWVAFDVAVAAGLFSLSARYRPRLARLLAAAVTLDGILTFFEAAAFNAPRLRGPADWIVVTVACLAPVCAAAVLWGAHATRARGT